MGHYADTATMPTFDIGDVVADQAGAYVNLDPRFIPDFSPTTGNATGDFDGSDTDSASTTLIPFEIVKSEPTQAT